MSKLSNISKHYLLLDYYFLQFTWYKESDNNRIKIILKELNRRCNNTMLYEFQYFLDKAEELLEIGRDPQHNPEYLSKEIDKYFKFKEKNFK